MNDSLPEPVPLLETGVDKEKNMLFLYLGSPEPEKTIVVKY